MERGDQTISEVARRRLEEQLQTVERALTRERDLLTRGVIMEEDYLADRARQVADRRRLLDALNGTANPLQLVEPHRRAAEALEKAKNLFEEGTGEEKRELVTALTWNLRLADRKVLIQAQKATALLGSWSRFPELCAWMELNHLPGAYKTPALTDELQAQ